MWNFFVKNITIANYMRRCLEFYIFMFWISPNLAKCTYELSPFEQHHKIAKKKKKKTVYPTHSLIYFARRGIFFMDIMCFLNRTRNFSKCFMCKVKKACWPHALPKNQGSHEQKSWVKALVCQGRAKGKQSPIPINH